MKRVSIVPHGWKCTLAECPPGLFHCNGSIAIKTEYGPDAYLLDGGEAFVGGIPDKDERGGLWVQPCILEYEDGDD